MPLGYLSSTLAATPPQPPPTPEGSITALAALTRLVPGNLSALHRRIIAALSTIDVHARDIVMDLIKRRTKDVNEFEWQMQLRYAMENEDLVVRQVSGGEGEGEGPRRRRGATNTAVEGRELLAKRVLVM